MYRVIIALFVAFSLIFPIFGYWGSEACSTVVDPKTGWEKRDGYWWYWYSNGVLISAYNSVTEDYRVLENGEWSEKRTPPWGTKKTEKKGEQFSEVAETTDFPRWVTHGVDQGKITTGNRYVHDGREITREEATQILTSVPDDRDSYRLTAIGPKDFLVLVRAAWEGPELERVKNKVVFQDYDPKDWAVERYKLDESAKFKREGKVVILQEPKGRVLHCQWDCNDGAGGLVKVMEKLGLLDKTPDLRKPTIQPSIDLRGLFASIPIWGYGLAILLFIVMQRKQ